MKNKILYLGDRLKYSNTYIVSFLITTIYFLVVFQIWEPFYHVNDDWIIRDIFSGRYCGIPDAHVYNIIYPFAWLFVQIYKLLPGIDWWGMYLCGTMIVCFFLIMQRTLSGDGNFFNVIFVLGIFTVVSLYPTLSFTFTTTGSMLGITAGFLLLSKNEHTFHAMALPLFLFLLSFCTRRDTFLMTVPYAIIGVSWYLLVSKNKKQIINIFICIAGFAIVILSMAMSHYTAFLTPEWENYLEFQTLRKAVHDYDGYPLWDDAQEFYISLGVSEEEYEVIKSGTVNTALNISPDIRTILKDVGVYNRLTEENLYKKIKENISDFLILLFASHPMMVIMEIVLLFVYFAFADRKNIGLLLSIVLTFVLEIMYLAYRGRFTYAVGNSMMICICWSTYAAYLSSCKENIRVHKINKINIGSIIGMCLLIYLSLPELEDSVSGHLQAYEIRKEIDKYCSLHSDNHYFEPAFSISSVSYGLREFDQRFNNLIVLGGWNYSSPEYEMIMKKYGLTCSGEIEGAIICNDNFYIVSEENLMTPIIGYLEWKYGSSHIKYSIVDRIADYANVYHFELY